MAERPIPRRRLSVETLEDRLVPSWAATPPAAITPPTSPTVVSLDYQGDASGDGWITSEIDYYRFVAPASGTYRFSTSTPVGPLDTVVGVFSAVGQRLGHNNNAAGSTDSDVSVPLAVAQTYFLGVTNLSGTPSGGYKWRIDGATSDDSYEENDTRATASDLGTPTGKFLATNLVMNDGNDWYKFTMGPGGSNDRVRIAFTHAQGDLGLRLYNAAGTQIGASLGSGDSETVSLNGLAAGTYFAQITGTPLRGTRYSLEVALADDRYEQNDTRATAADLGSLSARFVAANLVMNDSADWYKFTTGAIGSNDAYLRIAFSHAQGDLDLRLFNAAGTQVGASLGGTDGESISLAGLAAGTYYVQVYGWQSFNPSYSLEIVPPPVEDGYDLNQDNDVRLTASDLGSFSGTLHQLILNDAADWYKFTMPLAGRADNFVRIAFVTSQGDLGLRLYNAAGTQVGASLGAGDSETVSLNGLAAGTYYVQVTAARVQGTRYTLQLAPATDDHLEDNDTQGSPTYLSVPQGRYPLPGMVMGDSADWFWFSTVEQGTQAHYVRATFSQAEGDLDLQLYDWSGRLVASSTSGAGWDLVSLAGLPGTTYYLRVTARQGNNIRYDLEFVTPYRDDAHEDNDTLQTARDLGLLAGGPASLGISGLRLVDAVDWYKFTLPGPVPASGPSDVRVTYAGSAVVQIGLYDATGRLLRSSVSSAGAATLSMIGFGAGTYYLKVTERDGRDVLDYSLEVPYGRMQDDAYEENDTRAAARDLGSLTARFTASGLALADDADWYKFTMAGAGAAGDQVRITFNHAWGNLDLRLYNASGVEIGASRGTGDSETVSLQGLAAGAYYVMVFGQPIQPSYSLEVTPGRAAPDDAYEENDTRQTARDLGTLTSRFTAANLAMLDAGDWYKFTMAGQGATGDFVRIAFRHAQGDLDLRLYNAAGMQVGASLAGSDGETISLAGLASGAYYVQVYGWQAFNPSYSLEIAPGVIRGDDHYEENDTRATASDLGTLTGRFLATDLVKGDVVDWFEFTMPGNGASGDVVRIAFSHAQGDLELRLYDRLGQQIASSQTAGDAEQISLQGLPGGTYYVQVYSWAARNPNYSLEIVPGLSDDAYEENDTLATARELGTLSSRFLAANLVMGDAADWYKFTTAGPATASEFVQIAFRHDYGDLELQLYDGNGRLLRQSQGTRDVEAVSLSGMKTGIYYVKVSGVSSALNRNYSLEIQPPPADERYADDRYEDNDTQETATDLGTLELSNPTRAVPWVEAVQVNLMLTDSADWFRFTLPPPPTAGGNGWVSVRHDRTGTVRLDLYTPDGTLVSGVTPTQWNDRALLNYGWLAGTYYLKISVIAGDPIYNYSLSVGSNGEVDDTFEDNDTMSQATAGSAASEGGEGGTWSPSYNLVLIDVDWFRITIDPYQLLPPGQPNPGGTIYVDTRSGVDIGVELYDSQGRLVKSGAGAFSGLEGEYFLKFTPLVAFTRYSFGVNSNTWDDAL